MSVDEEWRPVVGFEGRYEVSDKGRVKSIFARTKILKSHLNHRGFHQVVLSKDKKQHTKAVRTLVLEAFRGIPEVMAEPRHKDGDRTNCALENLEWFLKPWRGREDEIIRRYQEGEPTSSLYKEFGNRDAIWRILTEAGVYKKPPRLPPVERFWSKVDVRGLDECWEWQATRRQFGHGSFHFEGRDQNAHRVAWKLIHGEIPEDPNVPTNTLVVRHRCDNPPCCNPTHLELGTYADNVRDMIERGRMRIPKPREGGNGRLAKEDVIEIWHLLQDGGLSQERIAELFGVSHTTIAKIKRRLSWRWLTDTL